MTLPVPRVLLPSVLAVVAAAAAVLGLASLADAQAGGERIHRFDVAMTIEADGDVLVEETIEYDFGPNERHGIFREIPVRFHYDDQYDRVFPIEDIEVTASGDTPADVHVEETSGLKRIRIGDEDRTITGRHTYVIRYRIRGALNAFEDHIELYWDAVGVEWPVPVDAVSVRVQAPAEVSQVACFAGPARSSLPCDSASMDGAVATFTHSGLEPFEGLSVVVGLPRGAITPPPEPILEERWAFARAFALNPLTLGGFLAVAGVASAGIGRALWSRGRDRRYAGGPVDAVFGSAGGAEQRVGLFEDVVTPVEYLPPEGLRPGQLGTLIDEAANPLDVTATIVDLAVRGYLRIEEVPKDGWFGKPDWRLVRLRPAEGLLPYEAKLHDAVFEDGDEVLLSDLKNEFVKHLKAVQDALYDDAVARGWFIRRPDTVRTFWVLVGLSIAALGVVLVVLAAAKTSYGIVPVPIALGGLALAAFSGKMPHRTARGTSVLRRARGFRRFIEEAERDQARFAEERQIFSEYLPYAVVFGAVERWAKAFEGLDRAPDTGTWYVSSHAFTAAAFASSMDDFAVTASGTIASSPSSSGGSGFGGGGFSGGGVGGGGGGSW